MPTSTPDVSAGLRTFTAGLIDYAGLFPPAKLPLPAAFDEFLTHLAQPEAWMLARFIIPAQQLADLSQLAAGRLTAANPMRLSVLGQGGADSAAFFNALTADLTAVAACRQTLGAAVSIELFEVRLPNPTTLNHLPELLAELSTALHASQLRGYVEVPFGIPEWEAAVSQVVFALADHNQARPAAALGLKLRTGGAEANAFPSPAQVAHALHTANSAAVPFKATAGLHHPFRHYAPSVNTHMHGFVNLFAAAVFAHAHASSPATLTQLLADETPAHFTLSANGLSWQPPNQPTLHANPAQIQAARQAFAHSYGSCSFDEPRADLRHIGWL